MGKEGLIVCETLTEWFQLLKAKWLSLPACLDASVLCAICVNTALCFCKRVSKGHQSSAVGRESKRNQGCHTASYLCVASGTLVHFCAHMCVRVLCCRYLLPVLPFPCTPRPTAFFIQNH